MTQDLFPGADAPVDDHPPGAALECPRPAPELDVIPMPPVDAARSAAGRLGAERVHQLARLGGEYERENGLTPGRQRRRQLIQLGKRYEVEHGLRAARPRRRPKGDAWEDFLAALARVVKPAHRPAVAKLAAAMRETPAVAS